MVELSVIIPTFNRAQRLRACLTALCEQTQPLSDIEVVVVVDGSTDGTCEMLAQLKTPYSLRVVEQRNRGQCAALNHGAEIAKGRFCLFLDDDIVATHELLAEHLRTQKENRGVVGIGQLGITVPDGSGWFARCFARGWIEHYERLNQGVRSLTYEDCYGGNMSVPRASFITAGGFALDLPRCYDVELAYRLERLGLSFVYIKHAMGVQDERKGCFSLIGDSEESGKAAVEISRRHPAMLPQLLGTFSNIRPQERLLCRLLLMLGVPGHLLVYIGPILSRPAVMYNWYRFVQRYSYWRGVRRALPDRDSWLRLTHGTPILMYHAFGSAAEPVSRYVTPSRRFARQMAWLKLMRYRVIGIEEYLRYRCAHSLPPHRTVVITIDDGYADNWNVAYPILQRFRFPATIFVVTDQVGKPYYSEIDSELNGRLVLSWTEVEQLARAGMGIGAHTRTHPNLRNICLEQARSEIEGSKIELEKRLNIPISVFSYPFGEFNAQIQNLAEQAGFIGSCSVISGLNNSTTPLHAIRRVEIYGSDSLLDFMIAVQFGKRRKVLMELLTLRLKRFVKKWFRRNRRNVSDKAQTHIFDENSHGKPGRLETRE